MFTANSMNCLAEALGMALPGQRHDPGHLGRPQGALRARLRSGSSRWPRSSAARGAGHGLLPREIATASAFDNAMILDMAMGGSTNTVLHILAIAHEAGVPFTMERIDELSQQDAEHLQGQPRRATITSRTSPAPGASTRSSARSPAAARACST